MAAPSIRVDVVVVLLTIADGALRMLFKRHDTDTWALPSGAVSAAEPLRRAAERVTLDQLGGRVDWLEQLYTFGNAIPEHGQRFIEVAYYGLVPPGAVVIPEPGGKLDLAWFEEPNQPALIGEHERIARVARKRLRGKLTYTAVGFELLPEEFSLVDLQRLYEIILDKELDKRNFRRKLESLGIVEPTGRMRKNPRGRSAELWRFKPEVFKAIAKGDILAF